MPSYVEEENFVLPEGAVVKASESDFANPQSRSLSWTPLRGQEGFDYRLCFSLSDSLATVNTASGMLRAYFLVRSVAFFTLTL